MLNFTRQERYVIYFLAITLGVGAIIKLVKTQGVNNKLASSRFYEEEQQFKEISKQINAGEVVVVDSPTVDTNAGELIPKQQEGMAIDNTITINLNTSSVTQLTELPGIGPALAQRIRAYTDLNGPFKNKKDIILVKGIGEKLYARIQGLVTTE